MALVLYTELKYKRIDCYGLSFFTYTGTINEENYPRVLEVEKKDPEKDGAASKTVNDEDEEMEVKFELDVNYLLSLDPKAWKDQDHYAVLGLQNARYENLIFLEIQEINLINFQLPGTMHRTMTSDEPIGKSCSSIILTKEKAKGK
jgi:hypothetical protein